MVVPNVGEDLLKKNLVAVAHVVMDIRLIASHFLEVIELLVVQVYEVVFLEARLTSNLQGLTDLHLGSRGARPP